ncbi:MAG: flavodoxin family protein [Clostridiaceae bacterium]|nr:flavodoxin family protein [Clostridiaceae bacterium]
MIVIISDDSRGNWGMALEEAIIHTETQVVCFAANTLDIKPCAACGSCSGKTFGRCIIQDDMQQLLPKIAGCQSLVLVSPIVFGGVSYHIKKMIDRISVLGDPRYHMKNGELVKGIRVKNMNYYMVGIMDDLHETERSAFLFFHKENCNIMNVKGQAFILDSISNKDSLEKIVQEIVYE